MRIITFLAQYAKFYKKLIFKKHRVSCRNLLLLGKRKLTRYLTLQEDHASMAFFYFGPLGPLKKVEFQACLTDNMTFLKWSH